MKSSPPIARWLALGSLTLLASGCVTTGDPYYNDGPAYPYPRPSDPVIIHSPGVQPIYPAYPAADWRHSERERERWERERRERERWEREQRDREHRAHDRDRDQREREARERERREREARDRDRRERDARREAEQRDRERDNANRRDYDRYNPRSGQWLPPQERMP